ncbi:MAG: glycosyltransferase family 2 protein [Methylococcales bacterium]|nr:glycosyltransferase family 2 protein [Methylococcales bacterium]
MNILNLSIAVLIPCYNEAISIAKVVKEFHEVLPYAKVYVYDNNSSDSTSEIATDAGAIVRHEYQQGKGNVVRRMFADVEADIYIMVDGDATYDISKTPELIELLVNENLDMINGRRVTVDKLAYRRGHRIGNRILNGIVKKTFGNRFDDMLSGYRVFSRRFVKTFPAMARGFEIETELTVHAMELRMPVKECEIIYRERLDGSESKLQTYHDGLRILTTISALIREERPLAFFGGLSLILTAISLILAEPVFITYLDTGMVPRLPTAILSMGLIFLAFLSFFCGLILDTVTLGRKEMKRLAYLNYPAN